MHARTAGTRAVPLSEKLEEFAAALTARGEGRAGWRVRAGRRSFAITLPLSAISPSPSLLVSLRDTRPRSFGRARVSRVACRADLPIVARLCHVLENFVSFDTSNELIIRVHAVPLGVGSFLRRSRESARCIIRRAADGTDERGYYFTFCITRILLYFTAARR